MMVRVNGEPCFFDQLLTKLVPDGSEDEKEFEEPDEFTEAGDEWTLVAFNKETCLNQREELRRALLQYLEKYGQPSTTLNIAFRIFNQIKDYVADTNICEYFSNPAGSLLRQYCRRAIVVHFGEPDESYSLEKKSHSLALFILNYLVTRKSHENPLARIPRPISDSVWNTNNLSNVSVDEIIERAGIGNGYNFPEITVPDALQLIKNSTNASIANIKTIKSMIASQAYYKSKLKNTPSLAVIVDHVYDQLEASLQQLLEFFYKVNVKLKAEEFTGRLFLIKGKLKSVKEKSIFIQKTIQKVKKITKIIDNITHEGAPLSPRDEMEVLHIFAIFLKWRFVKLIEALRDILENHDKDLGVEEEDSINVLYDPEEVRVRLQLEENFLGEYNCLDEGNFFPFQERQKKTLELMDRVTQLDRCIEAYEVILREAKAVY